MPTDVGEEDLSGIITDATQATQNDGYLIGDDRIESESTSDRMDSFNSGALIAIEHSDSDRDSGEEPQRSIAQDRDNFTQQDYTAHSPSEDGSDLGANATMSIGDGQFATPKFSRYGVDIAQLNDSRDTDVTNTPSSIEATQRVSRIDPAAAQRLFMEATSRRRQPTSTAPSILVINDSSSPLKHKLTSTPLQPQQLLHTAAQKVGFAEGHSFIEETPLKKDSVVTPVVDDSQTPSAKPRRRFFEDPPNLPSAKRMRPSSSPARYAHHAVQICRFVKRQKCWYPGIIQASDLDGADGGSKIVPVDLSFGEILAVRFEDTRAVFLEPGDIVCYHGNNTHRIIRLIASNNGDNFVTEQGYDRLVVQKIDNRGDDSEDSKEISVKEIYLTDKLFSRYEDQLEKRAVTPKSLRSKQISDSLATRGYSESHAERGPNPRHRRVRMKESIIDDEDEASSDASKSEEEYTGAADAASNLDDKADDEDEDDDNDDEDEDDGDNTDDNMSSDQADEERGTALSQEFAQAAMSSDSSVFAGCIFALSLEGSDATSQLAKAIERNGGRILDEGPSGVFDIERGCIVPRPLLSRVYFGAVIATRALKTGKYLQALALGWPCLSYRYILDVLSGPLEDYSGWQQYVLAAGESEPLKATVSQDLTIFNRRWEAGFTLLEQFNHRRVCLGMVLPPVFLVDQGENHAVRFLLLAAGAHKPKVVKSTNAIPSGSVVIYADKRVNNTLLDSTTAIARAEMRQVLRLDQSIYFSREWLIQCVINQRIV